MNDEGVTASIYSYCMWYRGVQLAKNDFGSVFGVLFQKNSVFSSVLVLQN